MSFYGIFDAIANTIGRPAVAIFLFVSFAVGLGCGNQQLDISTLKPVYDLVAEVKTAADARDMELEVGFIPDLTGIEVDGEGLAISAGCTAGFDLKLRDRSVIAFKNLDIQGSERVALIIGVEGSDGLPYQEVARFGPNTDVAAVEIPTGESGFVRLTLAADGPPGSGLVRVTSPSVFSEGVSERSGIETSASLSQGLGQSTTTPNVVLYLIDTLRKDRLGVYGYVRPVSPNIDAFAKEAAVFDDAVAQSPWTKPSVASIFTGFDPMVHKVKNYETHLPDSLMTMAEYLESSGYACDGFIENSTVRGQFGFGQGFRVYSYGKFQQHDSASLIERVSHYLNSNRLREPFFLHIHVMDPHAPYSPPEDLRQQFAPGLDDDRLGEIETLKQLTAAGCDPASEVAKQVGDLYDAEVANADRYFGKFVTQLKELGLYENTLLIVAVDHGEEFWDRGKWGHSHGFHSEQLNVPLLIKAPKMKKGKRDGAVVQHLDLLPTVLDYAGIPSISELPGSSLKSRIESQDHVGKADSDVHGIDVHSSLDFQQKSGLSVTLADWKLILPKTRSVDGGSPVLIHRSGDPDERFNLYSRRPIEAGYLLSLVRRHAVLGTRKALDVKQKVESITDDQLEELRALGYVD